MEVMARLNAKKTEPREEQKKPEVVGRPRDHRLRGARVLNLALEPARSPQATILACN